jgi:hypothetical protein
VSVLIFFLRNVIFYFIIRLDSLLPGDFEQAGHKRYERWADKDYQYEKY